jgi:hypothetical protein
MKPWFNKGITYRPKQKKELNFFHDGVYFSEPSERKKEMDEQSSFLLESKKFPKIEDRSLSSAQAN